MNFVTRRTFIQSAVASSIALAADSASDHPPVLPENRPLRIAIAGMGEAGLQHLDLLSEIPGTQVVALYDPRSERLRYAAMKLQSKRYPAPRLTMRPELILQDRGIDAVSFTFAFPSPNFPLDQLLTSRKAVLFDAPRADSLEEALSLMHAAGSSKTLLYSRVTDRLCEDAYLPIPDRTLLQLIGSRRSALLSFAVSAASPSFSTAAAFCCISWLISNTWDLERIQIMSQKLRSRIPLAPAAARELVLASNGHNYSEIRFLPSTPDCQGATLLLKGEGGSLTLSASPYPASPRSISTVTKFLSLLRSGKVHESRSAQSAFLAAGIAKSFCRFV